MSNEIIRAKKKIHALVNNQENLILTIGIACEASYIALAFFTLNQTHSIISRAPLVGMVVTILGMIFKVKEHEAETGEKLFWLPDDY